MDRKELIEMAMDARQIALVVDAKGLSCPMPVVKTAQAIKTVDPGAFIEVLATDPGSSKDMAAWAKSTGNELVEESVDGGVHRFVFRRK